MQKTENLEKKSEKELENEKLREASKIKFELKFQPVFEEFRRKDGKPLELTPEQQKILQPISKGLLSLLDGYLIANFEKNCLIMYECSKENCAYFKYYRENGIRLLDIIINTLLTRREYIKCIKVFFQFYWHPKKQPRYLTDLEKEFILEHRKDEEFSYHDLGKMLSRSEASIHNYMKKEGFTKLYELKEKKVEQ